MVSTSKILTVSYGTFSCTLEGFDDSFDTMKAIAEYFRDLAADDRYFGAEPPTPDAELLARIAEKEIARRVDAHHEEGKIVLRADDAALAAPPASDPTPEPVPVSEDPVALEEPEEMVQELPEPVVDLVEAEAEPEEEIAASDENDAEDDIDLSVIDPSVEPVLVEELEPEDAQQDTVIESVLEASEIEEDPVGVEDAVVEVDDLPAATFPQDEGETSVSERLRRIRSVVAQGNVDLVEDGYGEDEHAQGFLADAAADLDAALAMDDSIMESADSTPEFEAEAEPETVESDSFEEALAEDDPAEPETAAPETDAPEAAAPEAAAMEEVLSAEPVLTEPDMSAEQDNDPDTDLELDADQNTIASLSAQLESDDDIFAEEDPQDEDMAESLSVSEEDTLSQLLADAMPVGPSPVDLAFEMSGDASDDDLIEVEVEEDASFDDAALEGDEAPLKARVIKMKRSDFEAALADGSLEETFDEEDDAAETSLSPEDEADLQSELAAVEAELQGEEIEDASATPDREEQSAASEDEMPDEQSEPFGENRRRSEQLLETNEVENLSHLFDEAESQLDEPESNQRRNAIQHLRAAVAATKAEQKAGSKLRSETDENPYRSTLASVVRPRRSELLEDVIQRRTRPQRPMEARPAPLKLVAEQRVDTPREPIRPRRVMTTPIDEKIGGVPGGKGSFSAFAEEIGATSLPELLEAAAAYMSDVEGRDQFSRPMLMGKLKEVETEDFSREDGLRSFGHLLREGKLQKVKGGRFSVTDQTEFRGQARSAG